MSKHLIDFIGISKSYDSNLVLDDLNLYIRENEFLTLLGPSGCGKTTTLRLLGGFESPDKGQILFDGQDITALAANERKLNTVFQKYSLFPHMSIAVYDVAASVEGQLLAVVIAEALQQQAVNLHTARRSAAPGPPPRRRGGASFPAWCTPRR